MANMITNEDENMLPKLSGNKLAFINYLRRSTRTIPDSLDEYFHKHYAIVSLYGKYLSLSDDDMKAAIFEAGM